MIDETRMDPGSDRLERVAAESETLSNSQYENRSNVNLINKKCMIDYYRQSLQRVISGEAELPENWETLTIREQRDWVYAFMKENHKNVPEDLRFVFVGAFMFGDCTSLDVIPEWLDHEKFLRGQRFARDNLASIFFAQMLSLYTLFSFDNGLKPLIVTGKSSDPYTAFIRYLSTGRRIRSWYTTDVWSKDTPGYRDIRAVRRMHAIVREKLINTSDEMIDEAAKIEDSWCPLRHKIIQDVRESCPAAAPGQIPYVFTNEEKHKRLKGLSQGEMGATQFGFFGLAILYPERFGIHGYTDRDLDDFCHVWRGLGYLLGIEDEFNFCNGSLEEIKQRSRDLLEYWVKPNLRDVTPEWEHMLRCVMAGFQYYLPSASYERGLLYLTDLLDIPMPRVRQSMGYWSWIRYLLTKGTFEWTARIPGFSALMNRRVIKAINRALDYTDEELAVLKEKSKMSLAKGIAETSAVTSQEEPSTTLAQWQNTPFLTFLSSFFVTKCSNILKQLAQMFFSQ